MSPANAALFGLVLENVASKGPFDTFAPRKDASR